MTARKIIDTRHSIERFMDKNRFSDSGKATFRDTIDKVIRDGMEKIISTHNDESGVYGIHSKSTGIGLVIDWRPDTKGKGKTNHAIIVTILPIKNSHHYKDVSAEVIVEKQLKESVGKRDRKKNTCEIVKEGDFWIVLFEGKYYDNNATWVYV